MTRTANSPRFRLEALALGILVVALFCLAGGRQTRAGESVTWTPYDLPKVEQTLLKSASGASYRIIVATPAGPAPAQGYPVIYVVDGNSLTMLVSEIVRMNIGLGVQSRVEPAVVVGIGYPIAAAFDLTRRALDLTPAWTGSRADPDFPHDPSGGAAALRDFIDAKVKPMIEARFKIDRRRQTLVGHSLGGLFTLDTLFARPQSYQTYVAISPSIWWDHRALIPRAEAFVRARDPGRKLRVFLSAGDLEETMTPAYLEHAREADRQAFEADGKTDAAADQDVAEMKSSFERKTMVSNVRRMAAILKGSGVPTKFVEFPDEDHFSVVPAALGRAIPFALGDRLPPW